MSNHTAAQDCVFLAPASQNAALVFVFDENHRMHFQRRALSTYRSTRIEPAVPHPAEPHRRDRLPGLLVSRSTEIARAVGDAVTVQMTAYGEVVGAEQACALIADTFQSLIESAVAGTPHADRELSRFRELGARAAHWRLQLLDLTTMFNVALAAAHREFWSMAPPEDFVEIAEVAARCTSMAELARDACVDAFAGPRTEDSEARLARKLLAERLIAGAAINSANGANNVNDPNGTDDADPTRLQATNRDVASGYLVLACESVADESVWTRVEEDLAKLRGVLYTGDPSTLTVLFPAENETDALRAATSAADLVDRISDLAGGIVYAAQAYRPGLADLPAAVDEARRMLPLVRAMPDAQVKPYRTDDLLVELALAQQPAIRHRLARLISPLDAGTGLRRTLEVLLACNLDRERAATELCIHRRTLYYRMDRIRKLSGIDPNTAHGIQLLRAALTSARMEELPQSAPATTAPHPTRTES